MSTSFFALLDEIHESEEGAQIENAAYNGNIEADSEDVSGDHAIRVATLSSLESISLIKPIALTRTSEVRGATMPLPRLLFHSLLTFGKAWHCENDVYICRNALWASCNTKHRRSL